MFSELSSLVKVNVHDSLVHVRRYGEGWPRGAWPRLNYLPQITWTGIVDDVTPTCPMDRLGINVDIEP